MANECRSVWIVAFFVMTARFFAALITQPMLLSVIGVPGVAPGKSQEAGLYVSRYWVSVPRAFFERIVYRSNVQPEIMVSSACTRW